MLGAVRSAVDPHFALPARRVARRWHATRLVGAALVLLVALSACKKDKPEETADDPGGLAEDGTDATAVETDAELVTSTLVSGTTAGGGVGLASADDLAPSGIGTSDVGDGAKLLFFPRGCLAVAHDAAAQTVTYTFSGCSGPNGLLRITGEVKARYRTAPNQLFLDMTGTDLTVNRATVDWHATADITVNGAARQMAWKGELAGTTARGRSFTRQNQKVVTWRFGERCFGVSGTSSGNVRAKEIKTEISSFRRCQGGCPEAGGRITITDVTKAKTVTIDYDGTDRATYTLPKGDVVKFPLLCSP